MGQGSLYSAMARLKRFGGLTVAESLALRDNHG
jgi:hypothetical protein